MERATRYGSCVPVMSIGLPQSSDQRPEGAATADSTASLHRKARPRPRAYLGFGAWNCEALRRGLETGAVALGDDAVLGRALAVSCGKPGRRGPWWRGRDHKRVSINHLTGRGQTHEFSNRTSDGGAGRTSDALNGRLFQHDPAEQHQHVQGRGRDVLTGDVPAGRQPSQCAEDVRGARGNVLLGWGLLRSGCERLEVLKRSGQAGRPARRGAPASEWRDVPRRLEPDLG